jgi:phosphocarrier protein
LHSESQLADEVIRLFLLMGIMALASQRISREVTVVNALGLHARAAAKIAALARGADGRVWLQTGGERVDAKSVIDMLTLACGMGSAVTIAVDEPADSPILEEIVTLVESGFGE